MNAVRLKRRLLLALCVLALATVPGAQAQQAKQAPPAQQAQQPYKPEVGQAGKDVVWVPTAQPVVEKMLDLAGVTPKDYLIDLGSGDGRTVIGAAKRGAQALGIEYNPDMVALSKHNAAEAGVTGKASFVTADLFECDLSKATVITMFLLPDINMKLRPKLLGLKPGTRIVSNSFTMEDWEPDEQATITEGCESWCTALFWIVPARVEGTWRLPNGTLTLTQKFQMVSGGLQSGENTALITDGRMRGARLSFTAGGAQYIGRVSGDTIKGTVKSGETGSAWSATRVGT